MSLTVNYEVESLGELALRLLARADEIEAMAPDARTQRDRVRFLAQAGGIRQAARVVANTKIVPKEAGA